MLQLLWIVLVPQPAQGVHGGNSYGTYGAPATCESQVPPTWSEPYPKVPSYEYVRGESSSVGASQQVDEEERRPFITPIGDNRQLSPHDIVFHICVKCIGKNFQPG
ncbi:hypothetical protein QQ045_006776 [Rhodiola kirilowii]